MEDESILKKMNLNFRKINPSGIVGKLAVAITSAIASIYPLGEHTVVNTLCILGKFLIVQSLVNYIGDVNYTR